MLMVLTLGGGVFAVTLSAAILNGYGQEMERLAFGAYVRSLIISENWSVVDRFGPPRLNDLEKLKAELGDQVDAAAAWRQGRVQIQVRSERLEADVYGVMGDYAYEADMALAAGRALGAAETRSAARLCVMGARIAARLFPQREIGDVPGQRVRLNGVSCEVIGVFEPSQTRTAERFDTSIVTPFLAAARYFHQSPHLDVDEATQLTVVLTDRSYLLSARTSADRIMRSAHGAPLSQPSPFEYADEAAPFRAMARQRDLVGRLLAAIATVTLLASSVGYCGAMLAQVDMRRREIALQMASGASVRSILSQFLLESAILGLMGACVGALAAALGGVIAPRLFDLPALFDVHVALLAVAVGGGAGLAAGAVPAWRAAMAPPALAMRG